MTIYVSTNSENPILDAVKSADNTGYQTDETGRQYFLQSREDGLSFDQVYTDDAVGDQTVRWSGGQVGQVTPANTLAVTFTC